MNTPTYSQMLQAAMFYTDTTFEDEPLAPHKHDTWENSYNMVTSWYDDCEASTQEDRDAFDKLVKKAGLYFNY